MSQPWRVFINLTLPAIAVLGGLALWYRYGFEPLDTWELPLAIWINNLTGRSDVFDWLVIFFNNFTGEAICVVIIFTIYALTAARFLPKPTDWRRVAVFAGFIFVIWILSNGIGDRLEPVFSRESSSMVMGDSYINLQELHDTPVKTASGRSFPSNHGTVFFTVAFMCFHRWGWRVWPLFPIAVILSMPRVFTGAHWMTDNIIGSFILTWMVTAIVFYTPIWCFYKRMEDRLMPIFDRWMGITPPS